MVFAQHPDTVALADSYVSEILGGAFIAVAGVLIYIAVTAWPLTPITWLVLAAMVIYTAIRWRKAMPGKGARPRANPLGTVARTSADGGAALGAKRLLQIEQIAADPATVVQQRKQQRLLRYVLPITAAVGIALLVLAVHEFGATSELQSDGQRSPGTIVGLEVSSGSHSSSYYPVVEFRTVEDALVRFRDSVGSNPPSHQIGDAVTVLYLKDAPQPSAIIDRGYWNWLPAMALGLFGPLLSAVSLRAWRKARNN
jgi:hypothetical protein